MKRLAMILLATAFCTPASADDLVRRGREIAELNCSPCHAVSATDTSKHPEAPPMRDLAKRYPLDALEEAFVEGIYSGHPDMPEFKATSDQVEALLAYLDTIQTP